MLPPLPDYCIDNKPRTVAVTLPTQWLANAFVEWLATEDTFVDRILAYDGVYIKVDTSDTDTRSVVFVIDA